MSPECSCLSRKPQKYQDLHPCSLWGWELPVGGRCCQSVHDPTSAAGWFPLIPSRPLREDQHKSLPAWCGPPQLQASSPSLHALNYPSVALHVCWVSSYVNLFALLDFKLPASASMCFAFLNLSQPFLTIQSEGSVSVGWFKERKIV